MLFDGVLAPIDGALRPDASRRRERARAEARGGGAMGGLIRRSPERRARDACRSCSPRRPPCRCPALAFEIYFEHYKGSFGDKWMWTPIVLTPPLTAAGVAGVFSERAAKTVLPALSSLYFLDGLIGIVTHVRGVRKRPGGFQEAHLQPRDGAAAARARLALPRRRARSGWPRSSSGSGRCTRIEAHPDPHGLTRQRKGTTPQMNGRYPDYDVLAEQDHWDDVTRRVVLDRVENVPEITFFDEAEAATLKAFCDVVLAQDEEPRVPVLAYIDAEARLGRRRRLAVLRPAGRRRDLAARRARARRGGAPACVRVVRGGVARGADPDRPPLLHRARCTAARGRR